MRKFANTSWKYEKHFNHMRHGVRKNNTLYKS
jgi:hypothetical protein